MLPRVLEPEVMDTAEEAGDYDAMDHTEVNRRFVDDVLEATAQMGASASEHAGSHWLDVGTGTALIPIELCRRSPQVRVTGIDLAEEMLKLGRRNIAAASLTARIALARVDAKRTGCRDGEFAAVISNSIVHHIPKPAAVWAEMWRVLQPGGLLFVRDLLRPDISAEVEQIVATYAGGESLRQQQLFRQSLHAALTLNEVFDLVAPLGIGRDCLRQTSDRHWTVAAIRR